MSKKKNCLFCFCFCFLAFLPLWSFKNSSTNNLFELFILKGGGGELGVLKGGQTGWNTLYEKRNSFQYIYIMFIYIYDILPYI